jgi:outer membrane receptor protein involved in Fe transport
MKRVLFALPLFLTLFLCLTSNGVSQTSSGTINGTVEDPSKAAVNGAEVVLTNEDTGVAVSTKTEHKGEFIFPGLQPGMFTVTVHAPGFKELKTIHLTLDASHNLSAGTVMLQVGAPSQEVTVTAGPTPLQNSSSERSGVLDNTQIENLLSVGRDVMSLLRVMPGNVGGSNSASLGTGDTPTVNGVRSEYNNATVDGVTGNTAGNSTLDTPLNLDAIQEVTVLQSNYQAEYGKTAGANINLVTKSGTQNFHGSLYYYNRNEAFNANSYFNKFNGQTRPQYRYNTAGGTLGGPIFWPRKFNSNRNKLFFFLSIENDPNRTPEGLHNYTVPTVLERMGDFSQSYNQGTATHSASALIRIKNPNSTGACVVNSATPGPGCFPGNKIPNVSSSQQALMNIFPLPNFSNLAVSSGNYNFVTNSTADTSVNQEVIRVDYAVSEKLHVFFRGQWETINDNGLNSSINPAPWVWRINFRVKTPNLVANTTYAFSPTLMNEFNIGMAYRIPRQIYNDADLAKFTLNPNGYNINALNPAGNPLNLLPKLTFGGVKNAATLAWGSRFPVDRDYVHAFSAADNLTKIIGAHALKFGVNAGTDSFLQSENAGMGAFAYARDTSNPLDSNYAYSNTLLGNFDTYSEPTHQPIYRPRTITFEWYTQDQWKVNKRLTLDYGMRYSWDIPQHLAFGSNFVPALYDRGQAPVLYRPTANKQAVDPTTGTATYPAAYAGLYVPNTGNPANGMLSVNTPGYPQGAVYGSGVLFAPRFGFAFDPYGEGKTVIRGGYGIFYNERPRSGESGNIFPNPPVE